ARTVSPATPEDLLLIAEERARHPFWCQFGPLSLVRQMLGLALVSLALLLGVSLSEEVNTPNMTKSLLTLEGFPCWSSRSFCFRPHLSAVASPICRGSTASSPMGPMTRGRKAPTGRAGRWA